MAERRNILIVVFDGLQPAQIRDDLMPNLTEFARTGVTLSQHHPVFPTVTRVNASSLVTGCLPGKHGLSGNTYLCRDFDPHRVIAAMEPTLQQMQDSIGRVLLMPTLAETLAGHGLEYVAVGTGTSGNAYLHNPKAASVGGATIHPDFTLPRPLHADLADRFGAWPEQVIPNNARLTHARRILTEHILPERDPAVALIWSSEPDKTQHEDGVGPGRGRQALAEADAEFGNILEYLDQSGRAAHTDIFIVSDHGYSTISQVVPIDDLLRAEGFPTVEQDGGVAVAGNGGSALFYVNESDPHTAANLARWLTQQDWCGGLFASERVGQPSGTLPAALIGCDGPGSPDLIMSFAWTDEANAQGYAGHAPSTGGKPGQGQHGSMSRHELRNVGLARGPSFQRGAVIENPTGNVDLASTILHLLGIADPKSNTDGRVIREALIDPPETPVETWTTTHEARAGQYQQRLQISHVGPSRYVDWGNRV